MGVTRWIYLKLDADFRSYLAALTTNCLLRSKDTTPVRVVRDSCGGVSVQL
jgi:hypothetical protein